MKETKTVSGTPEARAVMHEMMAAFEAFKGANDARLDEIEKKASARCGGGGGTGAAGSGGERGAQAGAGAGPLHHFVVPLPHKGGGDESRLRRLPENGCELRDGAEGGVVVGVELGGLWRAAGDGAGDRAALDGGVAYAGDFDGSDGGLGRVQKAGVDGRRGGRMGGRDGGAAGDGPGDPGVAGVPVGRLVRQSGGNAVPAGRRHDRPGRMAGGQGRGCVRGAGDAGLRQRRDNPG